MARIQKLLINCICSYYICTEITYTHISGFCILKKILQEVRLNYIWLSNNVTNINWLCKEVETRLQMQFTQKWNSYVYNSPKCINYRMFKADFKAEMYFIDLYPNFISRLQNSEQQIIAYR